MKICISCNITTDVEHIYCYQCGKELGLRESAQKNLPNLSESVANKTKLPFLLELWQPIKEIFNVFKNNIHEKITYKEIYLILMAVLVLLFPLWRLGLVWLGILDPDKPPVIDEIQWHPKEVSPGGTVTLSAYTRDDNLKALEFNWKSSQGVIKSLVDPESQKTRGNYKVEITVPGPGIISAQTRLDVALTVGDGNNKSKEEVHIEIVPKNNPPILTSITCNRPYIRAGESTELSVTSSDKDKDHIDLTWECMSPLGRITHNDVKKEKAIFEVSAVSPFPLSQFQARIKVKADDGNGGTASREIEVMVLPPGSKRPIGSGSTPGISKKPYASLALNNDEPVAIGEQKWILKAFATGEGLTYRWTYNGEELSKESILIFDTSKVKTVPDQDKAKVTVTVEDKQKAKVSQVIPVPLNRPSSSSERH